jgi:fucose permease
VLLLVFILAGFSNGLEDGAWNAWLGVMQNANEVLGVLHAFYGLGALLSPLIATSMITKGNLPWHRFYYLMVGLALLEFVSAVAAFWAETGKTYRAAIPKTNGQRRGGTREAFGNRVTWICSIFLFVYVGIEVAVGGWVVVFMQKFRHAAPFPAGMSATGYWLGIMVGRVVLGFVTPHIGEKLAILVCHTPSVAEALDV